jgi:hypothetical protein
MPPRRSARVAQAAERAAGALAVLPHALFLRVLAALPVDTRARAACVCRAWREAVAERSLWRRLDLTAAGGVERVHDARRVVALLRAGAARARGELHTLLLDVGYEQPHFYDAVAEVTAHAGSLRELHFFADDPDVPCLMSKPNVTALLAAAPRLRVLDLDLFCDCTAEARAMLRTEPPYTPLRTQAAASESDSG